MKLKTKKLLLYFLITISVLVTGYLVFIGSLLTNGYRDYVGFCSEYIDQIATYKNETGGYPDSLKVLKKPRFSFRYETDYCRYYAQKDGFGFTTPCGLIGRAYYHSDNGKWVCD